KKPRGTGADLEPSAPTTYDGTVSCTQIDDLLGRETTPATRDAFGHSSHTFTHEEQNNATYADVALFCSSWVKVCELWPNASRVAGVVSLPSKSSIWVQETVPSYVVGAEGSRSAPVPRGFLTSRG
ncbi:hypothetical protein CDV57_09721, partial [Aspergillus fumigatus]